MRDSGARAAAARLNMPKSTVSRCLTRLEEKLDLRLIDRNTAVQAYRQGEVSSACAADYGRGGCCRRGHPGLRHKPGGSLKIAMPMAFSREVIGGRLAEFNARFPDIGLEVLVTSQQVNLLIEDIDVALAVGPFEDSS